VQQASARHGTLPYYMKLCRRVAPGEEKYYPLKKTGDSTSSALQKRDTGAATKRFSSCWPGAFPLAHAAKGQLNPPSVQGQALAA